MNDDETSIQLHGQWYSAMWNEENPTVQLEGPTILREGSSDRTNHID